MTTAPVPTGSGPRPVLVSPEVRTAVAAALLVGLVAVLTGALVGGAPAALGAAIGAGMVVVFFGFGALTVNAVASVSPAASMLVALLTYTLEVVAVGVVFVALKSSGVLGSTVDARWVAGTLIVTTLVWLVAQIIAATRSRQPLYDLPERTDDGPEASA